MEQPILLTDVDHVRLAYYANMRRRLEKEKLNDNEVDKLYDIIEVTGDLFDQNRIRYTIEGGTLLGAVRNGGLIKHDNDADFDVLQDDLPKIKALSSNFAEYGLEIIDVPGWGLQVTHEDSPSLASGLWTDGIKEWTSKWPFLDLIAIRWDKIRQSYILAQDVAYHDYPNYYLTRSDWENPFERVPFGHLMLWAIGGAENRRAYLDRHYKSWDQIIEMKMDHRSNQYFQSEIQCPLSTEDLGYRPRSKSPTTLKKLWPRTKPMDMIRQN
jgi:lipopolysaccharide cholinephosphotransferase